jgi:hypothetical protein
MLGLQEVIEMIECRRQKQDISAKQTKTAQDPALPRNTPNLKEMIGGLH